VLPTPPEGREAPELRARGASRFQGEAESGRRREPFPGERPDLRIFVTGTGVPLKQRVVKRGFRKLLAKVGIRSVRLYDLRHTAATLGIAAGVSVKVISDQLGHASISFTLDHWQLG
jgi:integrase